MSVCEWVLCHDLGSLPSVTAARTATDVSSSEGSVLDEHKVEEDQKFHPDTTGVVRPLSLPLPLSPTPYPFLSLPLPLPPPPSPSP